MICFVYIMYNVNDLCVCEQCWCEVALCADLVIEIPGSGLGGAEGSYRLDYRPPHGSPAPNYTVPARASTINFQGLPGTKYHFMLYYSNATFADLLTWNQTIITGTDFVIFYLYYRSLVPNYQISSNDVQHSKYWIVTNYQLY
jgi:hypothetical protein